MRAGGVPADAGEAPDVGGREEVDDGAEHLVGEHGEAPQRRLPPAAGRRFHRSGVLVGGSRWVEAGGRGPGGIRSQLCVLRIEIGRWELRCASGTSEAKTPKQGRGGPTRPRRVVIYSWGTGFGPSTLPVLRWRRGTVSKIRKRFCYA